MPTQATIFPAGKFHDMAEWWHALGDVPLERIVMDPWPGTATENDLLAFVERDKRLVELIDGTLVQKPMGIYESLIAGWIITALNNFVLPRKLGIVTGSDGTLRLLSGRVRLPDVAFIKIDDLPGGKIPTEAIPSVAPTLAVEVISEGNTRAEMRQKMREYFESGTRLVWLVYPKSQTIAVYEFSSDEPVRILSKADMLDGGAVLPGFSIPVTQIFVANV